MEPLHEPLALGADWHEPLPLIGLDEALEHTLLHTGISREALLGRLLADLGQPLLQPLLWVLPRRWRLAPADLPPRLQGLSAVLQQGLISPVMLAALVDDLAHLWPLQQGAQPTAVDRLKREAVVWQNRTLPLPTTLESLWATSAEPSAATPQAAPVDDASTARWRHLRQGLRWSNVGLAFSQSLAERCSNAQLAQVFNRLAANGLAQEPFCFEGCRDGASLLTWFVGRGWRVCAHLRCSVASFGFGASLALEGQPVRQIPLALPMRTGLLNDRGQEVLSLLPHTALELELSDGRRSLRLQWFQGTTGLCGWDALNDLHRPWQNDRQNGTVRYLGEPFSPDQWSTLLHMTELIALVHNLEATDQHLRLGGYGSLGFCIDSTALLQQALCGCCDLFPLVLPGLWRERLDQRCVSLVRSASLPAGAAALSPAYRQALRALPLDFSHHGASVSDAWRRLRASLPLHSPFALIQQLHQLQRPPTSLTPASHS